MTETRKILRIGREVLPPDHKLPEFGSALAVFPSLADEKKRDEMLTTLSKKGCGDVEAVGEDAVIVNYYIQEYPFDGIIIVDSDGHDLSFSMGIGNQPESLGKAVHKGLALDPRVEKLAEQLWDQIKDQTIDLKFENESETLERIAGEFLKSGRSETEDEVLLSDGMEYSYYLSRTIVNKVQARDADRLRGAFNDFLEKYDMTDRSNSVIVLTGAAMGNDYLKGNLAPGFKSVAAYAGSLREAAERIAVRKEWDRWIAGELTPFVKSGDRKIEAETDKALKESRGRKPSWEELSVENPELKEESQGETVKSKGKSTEVAERPPLVKITVKVETVKAGMFKKKKILNIEIDSEDIKKLPIEGVLVIQEKPLTTLNPDNIVREYERGKEFPFYLKIDLPLKNHPDAKSLRIYFKPSPNERVKLNEGYRQFPTSVEID